VHCGIELTLKMLRTPEVHCGIDVTLVIIRMPKSPLWNEVNVNNDPEPTLSSPAKFGNVMELMKIIFYSPRAHMQACELVRCRA